MKRPRDMATIRRTAAEFIRQRCRQFLDTISIASRSAGVTVARVDTREAKFRRYCRCNPTCDLCHCLCRRTRRTTLRYANAAQRYGIAPANIHGGYHGGPVSG